MPKDNSLFLKPATFFEVESFVSLTSFNGIKFTWQGDFMYFLITEASLIAPSSVSFLPAINVYSKEMRLEVFSKYLWRC
jgi:hypothetical protein